MKKLPLNLHINTVNKTVEAPIAVIFAAPEPFISATHPTFDYISDTHYPNSDILIWKSVLASCLEVG